MTLFPSQVTVRQIRQERGRAAFETQDIEISLSIASICWIGFFAKSVYKFSIFVPARMATFFPTPTAGFLNQKLFLKQLFHTLFKISTADRRA